MKPIKPELSLLEEEKKVFKNWLKSIIVSCVGLFNDISTPYGLFKSI